MDLAALVLRSDAIVSGRAVAIQELGPGVIPMPNGAAIDGTSVSVEVVTERSLKGDLSGPFQVELVHTDIPSGYGRLPLRIPQVFFVRRLESRWVVTHAHYPSLPAGDGEIEGATDLDRVISVIGSVLLDQAAAISTRVRAMEALGSVALPASRNVLQAATEDRQPEIRYRSIGKLLSMGDLTFLPAVEEALLQGQLNPDVAVTPAGASSSAFVTRSLFPRWRGSCARVMSIPAGWCRPYSQSFRRRLPYRYFAARWTTSISR